VNLFRPQSLKKNESISKRLKKMSEIRVQIDEKEVVAKEGMTILEAARSAGISIPTLCHHEKLEPFGGCRICIVEAEVRGWTKLVVSCVYLVEADLVVRTRSEKIDGVRKTLIELLLAHAPDSPQLQDLAKEYGADRDRFEKEASFCIHCGLCVRYCAEVKKANAIGFIDRGIRKEIGFIPKIASKVCHSCKECFPLCPTSYLQAAFVLTEALSFPSTHSEPGPE
jgi:NADH dehydrogenase/NADH:ubiquinone oxidoreductase subunit G